MESGYRPSFRDNQDDLFNCVVIYTAADNLGKWTSQACGNYFDYICESPNYVGKIWLVFITI